MSWFGDFLGKVSSAWGSAKALGKDIFNNVHKVIGKGRKIVEAVHKSDLLDQLRKASPNVGDAIHRYAGDALGLLGDASLIHKDWRDKFNRVTQIGDNIRKKLPSMEREPQ